MIGYIIRRLAATALVLMLAQALLALSPHLIGGDPVRAMLGPRATAALAAQARAEMGLDDPIPAQVARFSINALRGDLGRDFLSREPVTRFVGAALPHTLALALGGLALALVIGAPLGVLSAARPGGATDTLLGALSVMLVTLPTFVVALLLVLIFAVWLDWLPATGAGEPGNAADVIAHLILPCVALATVWIGYLARLTRAAVLDALRSDYARAARAAGASAGRVLWRHALRNALNPLVGVLGVGLGGALGGAVFIEAIFSRPGLGKLMLDAIATRNYPVLRGSVLVAALLFALANLGADVLRRALDPRVRDA